MQTQPSRRRSRKLWGLIVLAALYAAWLYFGQPLEAPSRLWGGLGVLLGLYICSNPAANAIDLLFFDRNELNRIFSTQSGFAWLGLNLLTLFAGWLLIFMGVIWITGRVI
jgi:hypothetical protein